MSERLKLAPTRPLASCLRLSMSCSIKMGRGRRRFELLVWGDFGGSLVCGFAQISPADINCTEPC